MALVDPKLDPDPILSIPRIGPAAPVAAECDEAALMDRVREGDVAAFEELVGRVWGRTFAYARHLAGDRDRAYDIAQEAFTRLWERRAEWRPTGSVVVWLLRTARNLVVNDQRKWKVRSRWERRAPHEAMPTPRTPLQELEGEELRVAMQRAIDALSPRRREAFTLFHLQELSYREIAEIMEVQPQSVANHLQAAIADLRVALGPFFPALSPPSHPRSRRGAPGAE
jgi:RNA polymerase sigma-70 factor (ECF subfamily)